MVKKNVVELAKAKQQEFLNKGRANLNGSTMIRDEIERSELSQKHAEKAEWEQEEVSRGESEGKQWAMAIHYRELRKIKGLEYEHESFLYPVQQRLGNDEFWADYFDEHEEPNEQFAEGFVRGALEILDSI